MVEMIGSVREVSTTEGTGAYALGGPPTGPWAGFVQAGVDAPFVYKTWMGNDYEKAIGTVADGDPDTITRVEILETLISGTYLRKSRGDSPTAVDWGAGTKTIDLIGPAESLTKDRGWFLPHIGQPLDSRYYVPVAYNGDRTVPDNQVYLPHYHARRAKMDVIFRITTGETDKLVDIGLYDVLNGNPNNLLESSVGNSLTSTGDLTITTSAVYNPGWYFWSYLSDATGTAAARGCSNVTGDWYLQLIGSDGGPFSFNRVGLNHSRSYGDGLQDPAGAVTLNVGDYQNIPIFQVRPSA